MEGPVTVSMAVAFGCCRSTGAYHYLRNLRTTSGSHHVHEWTCKHFGPQRHSESARVRTPTIILEHKENIVSAQ